jgi:hypothetical protein
VRIARHIFVFGHLNGSSKWFFLILCGYRNLYEAITLRKHSRIPRNAAWKKIVGENPRLNQIPLALSMRYIRVEVSIATENAADPIK